MTDIALDQYREIILEDYGDFHSVSGIKEQLQQITNRLLTPIGNLFYDNNFGSDLLDFIHIHLRVENYIQLKETIKIALQQDSLVDEKSININFYQQLDYQLVIKIDFMIIGGNELFTTHIGLDKDGINIL